MRVSFGCQQSRSRLLTKTNSFDFKEIAIDLSRDGSKDT
jgi:hypothetical protein